MKLKKIASLMLAGVMAASMLTACGNKTDNKPEDPTDPVNPGVAGVSADVASRIDADGFDVPEYVTFKDSTELDADLKSAIDYAGVMDVMPDYVWADQLTTVAGDIENRLYTAVGATGVGIDDIGDEAVLLAAENVNTYKIDDAVAFEIRAVSSAIGESAINQQVAEMIEQDVVDYEYSTRNTSGGNGGNYNHTYTVSVSTYTKAVNSSNVGGVIGGVDIGWTGIHGDIIGGSVGAANPSVTFVAVQVVRTSTHQ